VAAYVPCWVMWTTRERVIWLSGPGYTALYKVRLSTDDKERSKKINRNIYSVYIKVDILTALETVKNEAVVNEVVRSFIIPNNILKGRVLENVP
jgi:hypothetical protein